MTTRDGNCNLESMTGVRVLRAPSIAEEMAAWDRLGPRTRAVLNEATPVKYLAWHIVRQCDEARLNPRDPVMDARLERVLRADAERIPPVVPSDFVRERRAA